LGSQYFIEGYFLDHAFPDKKIAFEADGGIHFLSDGEFVGKDSVRDRVLQHLGWKVIHITEPQWRALSSTECDLFLKKNYEE
jgi:very-short-patch-repair endonuclease